MIDNLVAMGWGIILLAVIIIVGTAIITKFGTTATYCPSGWPENSTNQCSNGSDFVDKVDMGGNATATYLTGQLGSSGLAGYVPLIVIAAIGLGILGWFMVGKGKGKVRVY